MYKSCIVGLLLVAGVAGAQEQLVDHSAAFGRWGLAIKGAVLERASAADPYDSQECLRVLYDINQQAGAKTWGRWGC
jgi:hypothetical protein